MSRITRTQAPKSEPTKLQLKAWLDFRNFVATQSQIFYMHDLYPAVRIEVADMDVWFDSVDSDGKDLFVVTHIDDQCRYINKLRHDGVIMYRFLNGS